MMVSTFQEWLLRCCRQGTWKTASKYDDVELQALLGENDSQTQEQLTKQLDVGQQAVFNRLREVGKIQKTAQEIMDRPHPDGKTESF
ncbi:hypothetical protein Trydic_g20754 [Trypoxylus dichotomus]